MHSDAHRCLPAWTHARYAHLPHAATYLGEAEFCLREVGPLVSALPSGARVLEVGAGPCIALECLARSRPDLMVEGIEPASGSFGRFADALSMHQADVPNMKIFHGPYEDYSADGEWELVFLINVLEHLPDWRHFLSFVHSRLTPSGVCLVLCPNYGFPFESHFGIPIIGSKALTHGLFRRRIRERELQQGTPGLYETLNFVSLAQIRREAKRRGLKLTLDTSVVSRLIRRIGSDEEFARRQRILAPIARGVERLGMTDLLLRSGMLQDRLPYLKILLRKAAVTDAVDAGAADVCVT